MIENPKTTIWKDTAKGKICVKTRVGLPTPIPKQGDSVFDNEFGNTICTGLTCSGSENNVQEVMLTIQ